MNKKVLILIIIILIFVLAAAVFFILQKPAPVARKKYTENIIKLTPAEKKILAGADKRIEEYRMGTAQLNFITAAGRPISGANVKIEQTEHEFLFGANNDIGVWENIAGKKLGIPINTTSLSDKQLDAYLSKFNKFANYYNIPVYWPYYEPGNGAFNYELFDKIFDWVKKQGSFTIRASPSVWNNLLVPAWAPEDCARLTVEIEEKLNTFISRYQGRYDYLHVINELANPFRKIFSGVEMTKCIRETGRIEWGKKWLNLAREKDPGAKLQINEVSILPKQGFPELLDGLKDEAGKPLYDIIGIQSHMHNKLWPLDGVWEVSEGYSKFGVPIHFTEVSILSGTPMSGKFGRTSTPKGERGQAEYAVNFYTVLFSHPGVEAITWWNLSDYKAWKKAPAGLLRKNMSSKPAYDALMDLIYNKWWTKTETTTSKQGQAAFKGFFGSYDVTITTNAGTSQTFNIKLAKEGKRNFQLTLE